MTRLRVDDLLASCALSIASPKAKLEHKSTKPPDTKALVMKAIRNVCQALNRKKMTVA